MCVIIHKPAGIKFSEDSLRRAYSNNPHGFGYMVADQENNNVFAEKSNDWSEDEIIDICNSLEEVDAVMHFRWKTVGEVKNSQCHPFQVLSRKKHGMDLYMMHNGTIGTFIKKLEANKDESDTQTFVRDFLRPILKRKPSLIFSRAFQAGLEEIVGSNSKLCFMTGSGEVIKINESSGATKQGCWVSNTYSFTNNYRSNINKPASNYSVNNRTHNTYTNNTSNKTPYKKESNITPIRKGTGVTYPKSLEKIDFMDTCNVSVGTEMLVCSVTDDMFWEEGRVGFVSQQYISVSFTDIEGVERTTNFYNKTGISFNNQYFTFPLQEDTYTPNEEMQALGPAVASKDLDSQKGGEYLSKKSLDERLLITYNGSSFEDVYTMPPKDRLEFFTDKVETSFSMFNDMLEHFINGGDEDLVGSLDFMEDYNKEVS